jgi:hypothetical protein
MVTHLSRKCLNGDKRASHLQRCQRRIDLTIPQDLRTYILVGEMAVSHSLAITDESSRIKGGGVGTALGRYYR